MLDKTDYTTLPGGATSPGVIAYAEPVAGRTLACSHRKSKTERAFEAAAQHLGHVDVHQPTLKQVALLNEVSVSYVQFAIAAIKSGQVAKVRAGLISLAGAAAKARPPTLPKPVDLVAAVASASDAELAEIGHAIGIDAVWDRLIAPNL